MFAIALRNTYAPVKFNKLLFSQMDVISKKQHRKIKHIIICHAY